MFGPKIRNVFKSRWNAVFWSASVLLTAYCSVPAPDQDSGGTADEVQNLIAASHHGAKHETAHGNPWAKDTQ